MEYDELELDTLGEEKTALFVIISDTDATFNFVVSIMYSQLFNLLCDKADDVYNGRLPVHVRMLLDEFANIGQIPQFEKLIATIRSREISASIILQSKSKLKAIYKDNAGNIEGNCDTTLFLGGKEKTTLKELAEVLGKETIDLYNTSDTRGTSQSYGLNYQKTGKELRHIRTESKELDGYKQTVEVYGCADCSGCEHKSKCLYKYNAEKNPDRNKVMKINERWEELKEESHANIQSEEGILKRQTRSIQTEGHFGDIKENEKFRRFNYRSEEKVYKEFMLYAIGRNIIKYHRFINHEIEKYEGKQEQKTA